MRVPSVLAGVLAAFATAALAHALIGLAGAAYGEHEHASVGPVALAAVSLLAGLLLRAALGAAAPGRPDPIVALAARLARADLRLPIAGVAAGGAATLIAMEFVEQAAAFGRLDLADALGGTPLLGLAIVALVAALITIAGARCARSLVAAAVAATRAIVALLVLARRAGASAAVRLAAQPIRVSAGVVLAGRRPSRAPPTAH